MPAPRKPRAKPRAATTKPTARKTQTPAASPPAAIAFGPEICNHLASAESREWLVTNGLGGFASGTIAGSATRRYHGLLLAALNPPSDRKQLVAGIDEIARLGEQSFALATHRWQSGAVAPEGYKLLQNFRIEGAIPAWTYQLGPARLEKRIWMRHGENTTFVRYTLLESPAPLSLDLKVLVNYRDFHSTTHAGSPPNDWRMQLDPVDHGLRVTAFPGAMPFCIRSLFPPPVILSPGELDRRISASPQSANSTSPPACEPQHIWYRDFLFSIERERGLDDHEDQLLAAVFRANLAPSQSLTLVLSTNPDASLDVDAALAHEQHRQSKVLASAPSLSPACLLLASDQFLVSRPLPNQPVAPTVIAGYHWFGDWGRDTMIALPGLTLATCRPELARDILLAFGRYVDRGMLPNNFPDSSGPPQYNTIDATLWYFEAIRQYHAETSDAATLKALYPVLTQIIEAHLAGTRYNIHADPADGLLYGGGPGVQLTWMDAKVGDWVVTPRTGKPVEINALWINALDAMSSFSKLLGQPEKDSLSFRAAPKGAGEESAFSFAGLAARARSSFAKFWNPQRNCCFDVLDVPGKAPSDNSDASLRPNQLFAVSLGINALTPAQQKAVVDTCAARLLTPYGLRTLAPGEPGYAPHYTGGPRERDASYHQGTVWPWLIGPFVEAHYRVYNDRAAALAFLQPLLSFAASGGTSTSTGAGGGSFVVGSLPELFDAEPPHAARGAASQAWSVAELLRVLRLLS